MYGKVPSLSSHRKQESGHLFVQHSADRRARLSGGPPSLLRLAPGWPVCPRGRGCNPGCPCTAGSRWARRVPCFLSPGKRAVDLGSPVLTTKSGKRNAFCSGNMAGVSGPRICLESQGDRSCLLLFGPSD